MAYVAFLLVSRVINNKIALQDEAQSVAFSTDGSVVAVGCFNGHWLIFDTQTRELLGQYTDGVEPIQVLQYSPDGTMLALGSRDNNIYIYQVGDDAHRYSRIGKCTVSPFKCKPITFLKRFYFSGPF